MKKALSLILALVMVATMFAVITVPASAAETKNSVAANESHRNSVYDGTVDKTWYDATNTKTEYLLTTAAELAGLAGLVNTDGVKFEGVTIKLGADIIWNEGTFTLDSDNKTALYNGALVPENINAWPVIGTRPTGSNYIEAGSNMFHGNFDGQGHVVSGLYVSTTGAYASFFSVFCGEYIKNLSIVNSYFGCDSRTAAFAGFVTNKNTKAVSFENLYTNAIIVLNNCSNNARSGGIIGMARHIDGITFKKVWFDGDIQASGNETNTPYIGGIASCIVSDYSDSANELTEFDSCLVTGTINVNFNEGNDTTKRGIGGILGMYHTGTSATSEAPSVVNVKNCLVAIKSTNFTDTQDMLSVGAFIPRFETCWTTYTVTNSYFVPNGVFCTSNTISCKDADEANHIGVTFNGTLITTKFTVPAEETVPDAKIEKIADATGLSDEVFDLTGETASLKNIRTKLPDTAVWNGSVDTSWFDPACPKSEYVLTTAAQLAGLAKLVNEATDVLKPFQDITIKLGADIVLNNGTFNVSENGDPIYNGAAVSETNQPKIWPVIGERWAIGNGRVTSIDKNVFWGNFDGQGHTISGLYVNDDVQMAGLFSLFAGNELKNLNIINSYFRAESRIGSFAGAVWNGNKASGDVTIRNLYSNAFLVSISSDSRNVIGGIAGLIRRVGNITIDKCWFDGHITMLSSQPLIFISPWTGGIAGIVAKDWEENEVLSISNCLITGSMYAPGYTPTQIGGIIGNIYKSVDTKISNCLVAIKATDILSESTSISAIVGRFENDNIITTENCYYVPIGAFNTSTSSCTTPETVTINGVSATESGTSMELAVKIEFNPVPYIGANGNWWIGDTDTGVKAAGSDGKDGVNGEDGKDGVDGKTPEFKIEDGQLWVSYDDGTSWKSLGGVTSEGGEGIQGPAGADGKDGADGEDGKDGLTPYIGSNGNWWIGETDTGVKAAGTDGKDGENGADGKDGKDGLTPYIGSNGNWWIGETDTGVKAAGSDGKDGENGADGKDGINGEDGKDGADGKDGVDGLTPYIGSNGNWWIGETDTGIKAAGKDGQNGADGKDGVNGKDGNGIANITTQKIGGITTVIITFTDSSVPPVVFTINDGADGKDGVNGENGKDGVDGLTPFIGQNGNWWIGNTDTGVKAAGTDGKDGVNGENGKDGVDGLTPFIGQNGNWWIGDTDTGVKAAGVDGTNGKDGENGKDGTNGKDGNGIASITPSEINGVKVLIFAFTDPDKDPVVVPVEDLITNTNLNPDNTDIEVNTNDNDNGNDNSSKSCAGFSALAYLFALIATSAAVIVFKKKN